MGARARFRSRPRIRALVLAAGEGRRLRPLTDGIPKPLLPVAGRPVIALTLERLAAAGCEAAAVNLHHLGNAVRQALGDSIAGMPLRYSEEPELLGTLGALGPLKDFLRAADLVLVINGDTLCRWPLRRLVRSHLRGGARATLLLARRAPVERFDGGVGLDGSRRVVSLRSGGRASGAVERRLVFAGAHALSPDLLASVRPRPADIVAELYEPLLAGGAEIRAVTTAGRWHDLGTPRRYLDGLLDWVRGSRPWRRSWVSPQAEVSPGAQIRGGVVEGAARVEAGAQVEEGVLLPGARLGRGAVLVRSILGPDTTLADGSRVENRLVLRIPVGWTPGARDTVVGNLVYRTMDG